MAVRPELALVIDALVLEGVRPDDPLVRETLVREVAPALEAHGLEHAASSVASAVESAVGRETSS